MTGPLPNRVRHQVEDRDDRHCGLFQWFLITIACWAGFAVFILLVSVLSDFLTPESRRMDLSTLPERFEELFQND